MIQLLKFLDGPWEKVRGYLKNDLDTIQAALNQRWAVTFGDKNVLTPAAGGTGGVSLTAHGLLVGEGTNPVVALPAATNGQLPLGKTGADPVIATLTAGTGMTVTNAAGSITLAPTPHALLDGVIDNDTLAAAPVLGDVIVGNATPKWTRLPGQITSGQKFLSQTGDGVLSAVPSWQAIPAAGSLVFFFYNTASSIGGGYLVEKTPASTGGSQVLTSAGLAIGDTTLQSFATLVGVPNITFMPAGVCSCYVTARASHISQAQLFANFYQRTSGGVETLIATSALTIFLDVVDAAYLFQGSIPSSLVFLSTDRLVTKIVARTNHVVDVILTIEGLTAARAEMPSSTVDATNFVPYTGATANVDLGSRTLTTTGTVAIGTAPTTTPLLISKAASDTIPQERMTDGTVQLDTYISVSANAQLGTLTNHDLLIFTNGTVRATLTKGGHTLLGGAADNALLTVKGDGATSATSCFQTLNSSNVSLFRVHNDGAVALGTNTFSSLMTISRLSDGALPTTLTNADLYLHIGGLGFATNGYALIGFGYSSGVSTNYSPAYIGYQEILDTGNTKGDLIFGTRDVTTATQPVERLRILAAGGIQVGKTFTSYNGIATVSGGVPVEYATIDTTGLTANVGASTLYAVPASGVGMYRISAYVVETTAGSLSSTLPNVQIVYTDNDTGGSITIDATPILGVAGIGQTGALTANTIGTASSGVIAINVKASTTIQYQTVNYASNLAGMTYALHIKLEAL